MENKKSMTASEMGKKGGRSLVRTKGKKFMAKIGKMGMRSRWKNKKKD